MDKQELKRQVKLNSKMQAGKKEKPAFIDLPVVCDLIDQLDEPEKVVVPEFVAKFIEDNTEYNLKGLYCIIDDGEDDQMHEWLNIGDDGKGNVELFARAVLDDYEVEKEKKYWLKDKEGNYLSKYELGHHNIGGTVYWNYRTELAIKTTDKSKLEKIGKVVGGTVEEVTE